MSQTIWTFIIVGFSFLLYMIIAIRTRAGSTADFYVAGKGIPPIINGMATAADWMSAASFMSMAGLIAFMGYQGGQYLMGWTGGFVLLALLLAPYLRKYGKYTIPEFIGERFYSQQARLVAIVCALFISFTYVVGQMKGVGIAFSRFLEIPLHWGIVIGVAIVFVYAVLGGMKGITYTQVAQYVVLITAYLIPAIFISIILTGHIIPQIGLGGKLTSDGTYLLSKLDALCVDLGFSAYSESKRSVQDMFFVTAALMFGTAGLPHVIVRFFTVPRVADARRSAAWALFFIGILYTTAPTIAAFARTNLINTVHGKNYADLPEWFSNWEKTGLLKFEDKNGDGIVQYYNDQNQTYVQQTAINQGWKGNELKVDNDIMVLANPEIAQLPSWVIALVVAGGLAAALSTAAGLLLVISTSISHDLLKKWLMPQISEKGELKAARWAIGIAIIIAGYAGINPPGYVAQVVAFAFGLAASTFFPVIVAGIFSKRITKAGAIAGMLTGLLFTSAYIIYFKYGGGTPETYWWGISPEGIGTLGMLLNFLVMLILSYLTPPPPDNVQKLIEYIRTPGD